MAYQGISPYLYRNNLTNVQLLDDISASFNGTTTQFNLTTNGSPFHAVSARSLLIILGGIVQEPDSDYTVSAGVITFTTAPLSGLTFAARNIYGLNRLTGINDGLVTPASLSLGGPEWDTSGNLTVDGNITQTGVTNNVYINTDTPTVRPTLDLNFERDQRLDSRITFSRNSTATYLGSDGLIKTALAGEPRFEFDTDGNCLGLLIEESRTNLLTYSSSLGGTNWVNARAATILNNTTSPDGSTTASKLVGAFPDQVGNKRIYQTVTTLNNTEYTLSVYAKAAEFPGIRLTFGTNVETLYGNSFANFDLVNGVVYSGTGTISDVGNGWYRCSVKGTTTQTSSAVFIYPMDSNFNIAFTGDGVSGIYVWGAQLEAGSFPTSYIPTSGSTVTRSADNASITGTNFTDFYNQSEGTLSSISSIYHLDISNQPTAVLFNDSVNFIGIGYGFGGGSSGTTGSWINYGGDQFYASGGNILSNVPFKQSITYKTNDAIACVDGTLSSSDNNVILPFPNSLYIGKSYANYNMRRGHIRSITYYPQRLSNAQLQNLTS